MRVLVVEDDKNLQLVMSTVLEMFGHPALVTGDMEEASKALETFKPEVILVDLLLDGQIAVPFIELAKTISNGHHVRIIVISAMRKADKIAAKCGVEFLSKPFALEDLEATILGQKRNPQSARALGG